MTLFTLLLIMAFERVTTKSQQFHISNVSRQYFTRFINKSYDKKIPSSIYVLLITTLPAAVAWWLVDSLPGFFVFAFYLLALWMCLGCPVTRQTYKRYLRAANREDFQACALHSMSFGTEGGELSKVGKQLVLVNYRQYASVIIFFILLGVPGMIFYSLLKELPPYLRKYAAKSDHNKSASSEINCDTDFAKDTIESDNKETEIHSSSTGPNQPSSSPVEQKGSKAEAQSYTTQEHYFEALANTSERILFFLDWLPVRITAFGFLLVGNFANGLSFWIESITKPKLRAYDVLAMVAIATHETNENNNRLFIDEPLQMVKLVKRNIVFLLMVISFMTLLGVVK